MSNHMNPGNDTGRGQALADLLALWQSWNSHDVTDRAARRADAAGNTEQAEKLRALNQHAPSAMTALAAEHELTSLLAGWRWHTVLAAREQGATWADIADATSTASGGDPEQARQQFLAQLERARDAEARFDIPFRDADRYDTAAAPDPPDSAGSPAAEPEETTMTTNTPSSPDYDEHEHRHAHGDDPGVALEDAWFRTSLEQTVPADTPDRAAVIDGALEVARARFLAEGHITDPDEALQLLHAGDRPDPRAGVESLTAPELLVRAEQADNRTYLAASHGDLDDAYRDLEALEGEAWKRAETSGAEDDRALADYLGLLIEDPGVERFDEYTALHNTVHHTLGVPAAAPEDADAEPAPALAREWGHLRGELRDELDAHLAEHGVATVPQASPQNAAALSRAEQANQPGETDHAAFGEWGDSPDAARWSPELLAESKRAERSERDGLVVGSIVLPGGLPPEDSNDRENDHEDVEAGRSPVDRQFGVDAEIARAYDRGPWTETSGRQWDSLGAWARDTATESIARDAAAPRPRVDDAAEIARRLAEVRTQVAVRDAALAAEDVHAPCAHTEEQAGPHAAHQLDHDHHADEHGDGADGGWER